MDVNNVVMKEGERMQVNKIYQGDCLELIKELDVSPKLMILHPPDVSETPFSLQEYRNFLNTTYNTHMNKLHENGVLVSVTTDRKMNGQIYTKHIDIVNSLRDYMLFNYKIWCKSMKANLFILNFCHVLFFRKTKKITNNKVKEFFPDVWHLPLDKISGFKNKDSFATKLVEIIIQNFTNEGDIILDPFMGSGKTACVAKELNRNYIGFEIDHENVKIAERRLR